MNNNEETIGFGTFEAYGILILGEERTIYINGEITDKMAALFNLALLKMEQADATAGITLYINSPGGSVSAGLSMIDTMDAISCDVGTVCVGMAASMGAMILMCGAKGKRRILPHSSVLLHQPLGGTGGQASDIEIYAKEIRRQKDILFEMICLRTGQKMLKVSRDCDRNFIMNATEALAYGVVDGILGPHVGN